MFEIYANIDFLENPTCRSRVVPSGRTDTQTGTTKVIVALFAILRTRTRLKLQIRLLFISERENYTMTGILDNNAEDWLQRCDTVQSGRILSMLRKRSSPYPSLYIYCTLQTKSADSCELLVYLCQTTALRRNLTATVVIRTCTSHAITMFTFRRPPRPAFTYLFKCTHALINRSLSRYQLH